MTTPGEPGSHEPVAKPAVGAAQVGLEMRALVRAFGAAYLDLARRLGLSATDLAAIEHVIEGDKEIGPVELGHRLGIRSASATALVDRLEEAGHLHRGPHPTDRRRRTLEVTSTATDALFVELGPLLGDLHGVASELSASEREIVVGYLRAATEVLRTHAEGG
jgi:DNA-binding MarR family transcriptional regulator